ncbi:MAG: MBL fold metallo-hydrolase [Candidatus Odinarchaeota archaeon]
MLVQFLGIRGTVPTSEDSTVCFLVDGKFLFEVPSEFVLQFTRFCKNWQNLDPKEVEALNTKYGPPAFSKIEHVFLSHLHWDHWGGLRHLIHRAQLFEIGMRDKRRENPRKKEFAKPLNVYIPEGACRGHKRRLAQLIGMPQDMLPDDAELLRLLLKMELGFEIDNFVTFHTVYENQPICIRNYEITAKKNKHKADGSLSYKIIKKKDKLNVVKAKELGVPFDSFLSRLQRAGELEFRGRILRFEDIFDRKTITVGYSGDSPADNDMLEFYSDCEVLIHDTSYLTSQPETYHLDSHASLDAVLEIAGKLNNLKILIPVHFSYRYKLKELDEALIQAANRIKTHSLLFLRTFDSIEYGDGQTRLIRMKNHVAEGPDSEAEA